MNLSRKLLVLLGLALISLTGCAPPELPYVMPVSEFSFTGIWNEMLAITGAGGNITHLQSFRVDTRYDKIERLSATFSTRDEENHIMGYSFGTDPEGDLQWVGGDVQGEIPERPDYDPAETFAELDSVGIETIIDSAKSVNIRIDYIYNERSFDYADMYRLKDGELLPLREVSFLKDACAATIQIYRFYSRNEDTPFAFGKFKGMSDWWFTGEDIGKAETVVFAKHQQGPEFVGLLNEIYNVLPDGWEIKLNTHEGHMSAPQGMEEPLFILFFENNLNTYSLPEDPADTPIPSKLRLYFYDISEKETILNIIEEQKENTWAIIPEYFDENADFVMVTSPKYINDGWRYDEAMQCYHPLETALKTFFEMERQ